MIPNNTKKVKTPYYMWRTSKGSAYHILGHILNIFFSICQIKSNTFAYPIDIAQDLTKNRKSPIKSTKYTFSNKIFT